MANPKIFLIVLALSIATGCATTRKEKDYTKFNAASPRSILIVPVVNRSVEVTAPDYFLTTTPIPVAERGYYVFPVNLVKRVLEDDGLSDADLVHNAPTSKLCELFGADAVLYIIIERWDAQYLVLSTIVTVELTYIIKDGKTGETLWEERARMTYEPQSTNTGSLLGDLIAAAVTAAVEKAKPNYIPLAREANKKALKYPGPGFPPGPYYEEPSGR